MMKPETILIVWAATLVLTALLAHTMAADAADGCQPAQTATQAYGIDGVAPLVVHRTW